MSSCGDDKPPIYKKVIWGVTEALFAWILLSVGSLKPLQTISIAASLPFLFVMILMIPALLKELFHDGGTYNKNLIEDVLISRGPNDAESNSCVTQQKTLDNDHETSEA